jgi:hypothetical protein
MTLRTAAHGGVLKSDQFVPRPPAGSMCEVPMLNLQGEIPRKAHVSWKNRVVLNSEFPIVLNGIRNVVRLNPEWTLEISDDADVDRYLRERLTEEDFELIAARHIVEKVDLWRLLKLYHEGGLYMDIDRACNVPMTRVIRDGVRCVLATHLDINFSQDVMVSVPFNDIFKTAIGLNLSRRRAGEENIFELGPVTYYDAVCICLLGAPTDSDHPPETLARLRAVIDRDPQLDTYRETSSENGLLCRPDGVKPENGNGMGVAEFYASETVQHWANRYG